MKKSMTTVICLLIILVIVIAGTIGTLVLRKPEPMSTSAQIASEDVVDMDSFERIPTDDEPITEELARDDVNPGATISGIIYL